MKLNFLLILFLLVGCTVARDGYGNSPHGSNYQLVCSFEDTFSCKICQGINTSDQKQKEECRLTEKQKAFNLNLDKALIDKVNQVGIKQPQKIKFLPLTIALDLTKPLTNDRNLPIYSLKTLKAEEISKKQNNPTGLGLVWKYKITKKDSPKQVAKIDQQCPGPKSSKEFCRHYKEGKTYYYLRQVVVECHGQGEKCVARLESLLPKENQKTLEAQTSDLKKSSPATKIAEKPANTTKSKEKVTEERSPSKSPVAKPEEPSAKTDKPEVKPEVKPDAKVTNGQLSCGNDCYQVELVIHQRSFLKEEDSQATLPSEAFFKWPGDNTKTQRFVNSKKNLKFQLLPPKKDTDIDSWLKQEYGIISVTPARYSLVYQTYKPDPVNQRQLRLDYLWQDTTDKVLLIYYPVQPETSYRTGLEGNLIHQIDREFQTFLAFVQGCWSYSRIYIRFTDLGKPVQYTESTLAAYLFKPAYESKDYAWSEQRVVADYDTLIKNQSSQIDLLYFSADSPSHLKKQFASFEQTKTKVYVFTTGYSEKPPSDSFYLQIRLLDKTKLTASEIKQIFNSHSILDFFSGGK
ncbi:MAG: hypothetical protein BWK78_04140 [Thiotrichaceae bacterium IS1]|nr:MAG: hypothetical protein BWK78_04140 [Thiotrichaceae bacterium IS1]